MRSKVESVLLVLVAGLAMVALSVIASVATLVAMPEFKPVPAKKKFTA
jgi:hypothetical protein